MGGGASGKGTSQATTTQTANNEQVAAQSSGIALGAKSTGNVVNVSSADPEVAKYAIAGGAVMQAQSLDFAGHAADVAAHTNESAINNLSAVSAFSIEQGNMLATKFIDGVSDVSARQIGLLQNLSNDNANIATTAQRAASAALDASFGVSKSVAPQDPSYALQTTLSKLSMVIIGIVAAVFLGFYALRKKNA